MRVRATFRLHALLLPYCVLYAHKTFSKIRQTFYLTYTETTKHIVCLFRVIIAIRARHVNMVECQVLTTQIGFGKHYPIKTILLFFMIRYFNNQSHIFTARELENLL